MPATGVWVPEGINVENVWQFSAGHNGFNAWVEPSKVMGPSAKIQDRRMMQAKPDTPKKAKSPTPAAEPRRAPTAARAAKRQRGRERRKMYKALAHAAKLENDCAASQSDETRSTTDESVSDKDKQALDFEARAAAVTAELKLVVKHTFFDVCIDSEDSSSDDEISLPPAFFKTTKAIDGWRRDYRRFRLGHHQGAKGEVEKVLDLDAELNLAALDLRCTSFPVQSGPCAAQAA